MREKSDMSPDVNAGSILEGQVSVDDLPFCKNVKECDEGDEVSKPWFAREWISVLYGKEEVKEAVMLAVNYLEGKVADTPEGIRFRNHI